MTTKTTKGMSTPLARGRAGGSRRGGVVDAMRDRASSGEGRMVPVADIQPNPDNPEARSRPSEALVNSVREVGVIQDLVLVPVEQWLAEHPNRDDEVTDAPYVVLAGHQRLAAAAAAERDEVPARVREDFDATTLDSVVLHENLHRMALTPVEEAEAYRRIMDRRNLSQRSLAKHVGVSQSQIAKKLKLLDLPPGVRAAVSDGLVGIEESAIVLKEDPEVIEVIDHAIVLAAEGDEVDIDRLVVDARVCVREQAARATAQQQADERQAPFVEHRDLRGQLGLNNSEHALHRRLRDDEDIAAAQEAGTLVVSAAPASPWGGGGQVEFYTTAPPKKAAATTGGVPSSDHQRTKANRARRAALREIVSSPPKTDVIRRELLTWAIEGGGWGSEVSRVAQPLLEAAGLIEEGLSYWDIRSDLPALTERQQYHAAWILIVARRDEQVGLPLHHNSWQRIHLEHYAWMAEQGYEPDEWEQQMLTAAKEAVEQAPSEGENHDEEEADDE